MVGIEHCHAGLPTRPPVTALIAAYLAGLATCPALRRANVSVTEQSLLAVQVAQAKQWWGWSTATLDVPCTWAGVTCEGWQGPLAITLGDSGLTGAGLHAVPTQGGLAACYGAC